MKHIEAHISKCKLDLKILICMPIYDEKHKIDDSWYMEIHIEGIY